MAFQDIQILRMCYLRGPNIWTYRPVVEAWVDIGELENHPSNTIAGFYDRLQTLLPGLVEHRCGIGERGGFLKRLQEGTWPGHIMEHVAIELQNLAGMQVGFGKARETSGRGVYKVVIRTRQKEIGIAALQKARAIVMATINNTAYDLASTVAQFKAMVDRMCLGPSTACIVDAATDRGIPFIRLTEGNLVQLGYGAKQRRIWTAETDRTSAISETISSDKDLTKQLLSQCGVPIPQGKIVHSANDAWQAAQDIGLPVVVKPIDGNHGRGVALDLNSQTDIEAAYHVAINEGSEVMVERYIRGDEHRLLVVGNRVVAAAKGETATITGDGVSTVEQLIETQINSDPRRGEEEDFPLDTIRLSEHQHAVLELQRQGLQAHCIPEKDRVVIVQRNGNMSHDVTDQVHPEVAHVVALAARIIGLDIAGIDLVAQDISKPLQEQGGAIVEVNAGPGLLMHLKPASGNVRPVGKAIADHLFDPKQNGRIPVIGVIGTQQSSLLCHLIAWLMHLNGHRTGLACQDGLYMNQRQTSTQDARRFDIAERLLINRAIDAAVFETSALDILDDGLPYDRCHIGVVTDMPTPQGLDIHDVHTPEGVRNVVRSQVDLVLPQGAAILHAQDLQVVELADLCDGEVIFYSVDANHPVLKKHQLSGKRTVYFRDNHVTLARGDQETLLFHLNMEPIAQLLQKENIQLPTLLAAVASAWALDIAPLLIRAGLKNFGKTPDDVAQQVARMNA